MGGGGGGGHLDDFWSRLRKLLIDVDKKPPWLARQIGVSPRTVLAWTKRRTYPRADHALAIARALGISVDYLLTGSVQIQGEAYEPHFAELCRKLKLLTIDQLNRVEAYVDGMAGEQAQGGSRSGSARSQIG